VFGKFTTACTPFPVAGKIAFAIAAPVLVGPNFADASNAERIQLRVGDIDGRDIGSPGYQRSPEGVSPQGWRS